MAQETSRYEKPTALGLAVREPSYVAFARHCPTAGGVKGMLADAFADVGGFLAVELPAEDGVEAFDLDHDRAGGGGRDLDVDAQPFARGGLRRRRRRARSR